MDYFAEDKADKLKRLPVLRIVNILGMVRWDKDSYGCAHQRLRMLHPLSWLFALFMLVSGVILYGVLEVSKELKTAWHRDCAW